MIAGMHKRWIVRERAADDFVRQLPDAHTIVPQLLWNRGIRSAEEAKAFFEPSFEQGIHDPFLFRQMRTAVDRLFKAIEQQESITVFGDYDADGITGSTVLITTLREIEGRLSLVGGREAAPTINDPSTSLRTGSRQTTSRISSYIPHRDKEGYGLQMVAVDALAARKAQVVVTVDCGIACVNEIAYANTLGMEVIVVDHHQFGETLPDGILIHPSLPGEVYPFKSLAAVGVAWKLASALIVTARERGLDIPEGFEKWLLDLVSIATVTDMVPLVGENRVLEQYGLRVLNKTKRPGLSALLERARLERGNINARDVGFAIGPRINAAGRMDHASVALDLLLATSEEETLELSQKLEDLNRARQQATEQMMKHAERMLEEAAEGVRMHILWHDSWSPALVGLVAGRMADRYGMPVVAIGKHGDHWIGSGRSFPAYDITAAVKRVGEGLLTRSGGHVQACGFSLAEDQHIPIFAERLREDAAEHVQTEALGPTLDVDAELGLDQADWKLVEALKTFAPFGCGNPEPVFVSRGLRVVSSGTVGANEKHLRFVAKSASGAMQKFIAFNFGKRLEEARPDRVLDVTYQVGENVWNGRREIQCKVVDLRAV